MRALLALAMTIGLGCSSEGSPDRKPGNAPGAPRGQEVLLDAGDVTERGRAAVGSPADAGAPEAGRSADTGAR